MSPSPFKQATDDNRRYDHAGTYTVLPDCQAAFVPEYGKTDIDEYQEAAVAAHVANVLAYAPGTNARSGIAKFLVRWCLPGIEFDR